MLYFYVIMLFLLTVNKVEYAVPVNRLQNDIVLEKNSTSKQNLLKTLLWKSSQREMSKKCNQHKVKQSKALIKTLLFPFEHVSSKAATESVKMTFGVI